MTEKLDPALRVLVERLEGMHADGTAAVDVMIGLDVPMTEEVKADLVARGLQVRSEIGDVDREPHSPRIVKIEASAPPVSGGK